MHVSVVLGYVRGLLDGQDLSDLYDLLISCPDKHPLARIRGLVGGDLIDKIGSFELRLPGKATAKLKLALAKPILKKRAVASYVAGIVDIRGVFSSEYDTETKRYVPKVELKASEETLRFVHRVHGGHLGQNAGKVVSWSASDSQAAAMAKKVSPYVTFTHDRTECLRLTHNANVLWGKREGKGNMLPPHVLSRQYRWALRITTLPCRYSLHVQRLNPESGPVSTRSDSPIYGAPIAVGLNS